MNADVVIIIVTWNSMEFLPACIASIPGAGGGLSVEVMIVDNQSTDGTKQFVESVRPPVRFIANDENRGFAAANNQALRLARGRYILLLNPDTILHEGAIARLAACLEGHPGASAAGPTVLNRDGTLQRTGVAFPSLWNLIVDALFLDRIFPRSRLFGGHRRLFEDPRRVREVDYTQGSCLLVRFDALTRGGILDEDYFMYFEETDWCYRMRRAGGRVLICPEAEVVHFGGEPGIRYDEGRLINYHRGLLTFFRKHRSTGDGILLRLVLAFRIMIRISFWGVAAIVRSGSGSGARSSFRGYRRSFGLLLTERLR